MHTVAAVADVSVSRPTQLIAEALLERHDPDELTSRAQRLGFSPDVTRVVVTVCCRDEQDETPTPFRNVPSRA